ncbi:MAG: thiamine pyrophosphate-dependent dehydrogenase E1 component subunit alpha [Alphaproteobacteria bacterium]|nr:thiamine pyrophosphate-dependent dehydrogenase E1 component subunit alpha [Alphaproteobacteria bacterium]
MLRIRAFEETAEAASKEGLVKGAIHLSIGQEAVASGVCANLRRDDMIASTHRGHGHTIAKGADPAAMMKELFGRDGGNCGGKGGSMHIADFTIGMLGANGVVAAGLPIAVGAAHAAKLQKRDVVSVCFFGDGAINRGPFLEALNWAQIYRLPMLFVCEDNQWASTTRTRDLTAGEGAAARGAAMGIPATTLDGNDVEALDAAAAKLVAEIRAGGGPRFLHVHTYRLKGHTAADAGAYRKAEEVEAKWAADPVARTRARLAALGVADAEVAAIERGAREEIAAAHAAAKAAPWPALDQAYAHIQDTGHGQWR